MCEMLNGLFGWIIQNGKGSFGNVVIVEKFDFQICVFYFRFFISDDLFIFYIDVCK